MTKKLIDATGELKSVFIGSGQKKKRGANGLFEATKNGIMDNNG